MGKHAIADTVVRETIWERLDKYAKSMVALAGAFSATAAQVGLTGPPNTWQEWVQIGIYFLTAAGVRQVRNREKG